MTAWRWECFEGYTNSDVFEVVNAGPLLSPIRTFKITRNEKLDLILETLVVGNPKRSSISAHPSGTVRLTTDQVDLSAREGMRCVAHGVLPFSESTNWNPEQGNRTIQKAKVHYLAGQLRNDLMPSYTIDWLENLQKASGVWTGSLVRDEQEIIDKRTLGRGAIQLELSERNITSHTMSSSALEMIIDGAKLFLCTSPNEVSEQCKRPGYIFYVGCPTDSARKKIREVLSFCLGNYLVYLGSTTLSANSEIITFSAMSPPSIGRIFDIPIIPPAPLGDQYEQQVDERAVARMANAFYAHYDEVRFDAFSWAYWHARCAPVHMAAAHFGAAIEAIQAAYVKSHLKRFETTLIADSAKWKSLKDGLLKEIADAGLDPSTSTILNNKVSNLNQMPPSVTSEKLLADIGIRLGVVESAAWKRRNVAAHGGELERVRFNLVHIPRR